jgi:hypothetical protein
MPVMTAPPTINGAQPESAVKVLANTALVKTQD